MKRFFLLFFLLLLSLSAPAVLGTLHTNEDINLPPGLQQINLYNEEVAQQYLTGATIFIAFLAGILTLLSPCILPLLPAFFSYSFATKKQITKMTLFFFLGFALMFIAIALTAVFLGVTSTVMFQLQNLSIFTRIIGALLILVGILGVLGIGFPVIRVQQNTKKSAGGLFLYGLLFAVGWTVCVGPILSGIILMASIFQNYALAAMLMFFYSLGMFLPLFVFSLFWDKYNLSKLKWIKGKVFTYQLLGKERQVHTSGLIAGALFILLGLAFLLTAGTGVVNSLDPFGTKFLFYEWQPLLLQNSGLFNGIGIVALLLTVGVIIWGLKRRPEAKR